MNLSSFRKHRHLLSWICGFETWWFVWLWRLIRHLSRPATVCNKSISLPFFLLSFCHLRKSHRMWRTWWKCNVLYFLQIVQGQKPCRYKSLSFPLEDLPTAPYIFCVVTATTTHHHHHHHHHQSLQTRLLPVQWVMASRLDLDSEYTVKGFWLIEVFRALKSQKLNLYYLVKRKTHRSRWSRQIRKKAA